MKKLLLFSIVIIAGVSYIYFLFSDNNTPQHSSKNSSSTPSIQKNQLGEIITSSYENSFPISAINESNKRTLPASQNILPKYAVNQYLVTFTSLDEKNEPITITVQYFLPDVETTTKFPLYVFGSGTTGIGDNCAPSKEQPEVANWANYRAHMLSYASQGYIVVFPDYEGFNDPERIHHYFNSEMESKVLLDAARSFYKFSERESFPAKPSQDIFLTGFSQGGHAALSAKDFAREYAPELAIKGVIAYAPASNIEALLKEAPALSPYLFSAYADLYGRETIDPAQVLQSKWLTTLETDVKTLCVDTVYKYYGYDPKQIYTETFYDALFNAKLGEKYPKFKEMLDYNYSGTNKSEIPSLIVQGVTDPIVTAKTVKGVVKKLCESGNIITYIEYPNINHFKIRQISVTDTLTWMQTVLSDQIPTSNCNTVI